jgi:hypothetical protein
MSDFNFNCPHCNQHLEAPQELMGQTIPCPSCNGAIRLPDPQPEPTPMRIPVVQRPIQVLPSELPNQPVSRGSPRIVMVATIAALVCVAVVGLLFLIAGGHVQLPVAAEPATIDVEYTSGHGTVSGAFDKSSQLELSNFSFDGRTVVFNYKNLKDDEVGGWVFGVIVKTYTKAGVEVDTVEKTLYPGEVRVPCTGKIISIPTDTKQQKIARVSVEHMGTFSQSRFRDSLNRRMGR